MKKILDKLSHIASDIESERGPFVLFAMFLYENGPDLADLVVSAPWLDESRLKGLRYIFAKMSQVLKQDEMMSISRIAPVASNEIQVNWEVSSTSNPLEVSGFEFLDNRVKQGRIFSAHQLNPSTPVAFKV